MYSRTHRLPLTRALSSSLYSCLSSPDETYRDWLTRQGWLPVVASLERDWWTLLSGRGGRLGKLDEIKIAKRMRNESSIRRQTLARQLTSSPRLAIIPLRQIRLAHPLALDQVPSQARKFQQRCSALSTWKGQLLDYSTLERLIPSSDPIVITEDPLGHSLYVSATGNGRMASLKATLSPSQLIEVLMY